jgi:Mlc titration factor MtfA (ptsG expression regulator)
MDQVIFGAVLILIIVGVWLLKKMLFSSSSWKAPKDAFPDQWKKVLKEHIPFYNNLNSDEKSLFEFKVHEFIINCRIKGVKTTVDYKDKLLVASSAVIPIFQFPNWQYLNLDEVLIYPHAFNENFELKGRDRNILGMVGTGIMEGKMILSKKSLYHGFQNETDKKNTAIHEFVHLIDKADGKVDGIPEVLLEQQYVIP